MTTALTSIEVAGLVRDIALISFFVVGTIALLAAFFLGLAFYRRTKRMIDRVDAGIERVEAMVDTVDSTASTVRRTATSMNRGMKAGEFARSAVGSMFRRGNGRSDDDDDRK